MPTRRTTFSPTSCARGTFSAGRTTASRAAHPASQGAGLTDVCCVTTRYFGGTLLGSGGLVRAYSAAARAALREAGTAVMRPWRRGSFACSYARYERLRRLLEERGARVEETLFGAEVEIVFSAPETQSESFVTLLRDATAGEAEVRLGESVFRPEREEE